MKKSIRDFLKANGFYLAFGIGVVALVAALAVYNVNSRKSSDNQDINLNEPIESNVAENDTTNDISDVADGDLDVPMDMQNGVTDGEESETDSVETAVIPEAPKADEEDVQTTDGTEEGMIMDDASGQEAEEVLSSDVASYTPLDGLEFLGMEEVSMPVLGNIILPYSMDMTVYFKTLDSYRCNPGMLLQAPEGAEVASIWHGQVTAIEDSKEYGTTVTVNLGSGYELTYGQLQDVRVSVGDEVYQDTILGTVAAPTAYYQEEGSHVYLALTKDGEPMNPMDVLQLE